MSHKSTMYIIDFKKEKNQECVFCTRIPHSHYHFLCSVDHVNGGKTLIKIISSGTCVVSFKLIGFPTSSKTTSTKNFNLKQDSRTNERTDERT